MSSKSMGKSIGTNIRKFRMEKGISQETLASALYVNRQTVSNYETGRSQPDLETLQKLSTLLDVEVTWLLYGKPEPGASKKKAAVMLALAVLASVIVTILLCRYTDALFRRTYDPTLRLLVRLVQVPLCMTFLGAAAMQGLDWSIGVGQVRKKQISDPGAADTGYFGRCQHCSDGAVCSMVFGHPCESPFRHRQHFHDFSLHSGVPAGIFLFSESHVCISLCLLLSGSSGMVGFCPWKNKRMIVSTENRHLS